ncbi:MAG: DUF2059 domain-containing protein [Planctomycetota bacterium]
MRRLLLLVVVLGFISVSRVAAQDSNVLPTDVAAGKDAKRQDVRRLLVLTGSGNLGKQVVNQMVGQMKQQNLNIPDEFWKEFVDGVSPDELIDLTVPVYEKHLTHDDVKQLIKFYESPVGRKLVKVQPLIVQDSMQIGAAWGRGLARKAIARMQAKGLVPGGAPAAGGL